MRHTTTATDGARISTEITGTGPALLLIPGLAADHTTWGRYRDRLSERFTVIALDHRGTGASDDATDDTMTTRTLAADAARVLADTAGAAGHVYGHSMGARVAQWLAIDHPDLVATLTLGAGTGGDRLGVPRPAEATAAMTSGDPDAVLRLVFGSDGVPDEQAASATGTRHASPDALRHHIAASTTHDAWDHLHRITARTLVLHGTEDRITPYENAIRLTEAIQRVNLQPLEGSGHVYYLERRDGHDEFLAHTLQRDD